MEKLQCLKYLFKQLRLDFTGHLVAGEDEFRADAIHPDRIIQLLSEGNMDELFDLLSSGEVVDLTSSTTPSVF